jgi:GT2 family glycosyltransferase/SAM-dependent methyltransferase
VSTGVASIIVLAWRGGESPPVMALIRSVAATVTAPFEIVVVCNGQDHALVEQLRREPAVTRTAFLTQNSGVARGWNIGAHLALGEDLVFVNEDVVVGEGCIDALVSALRTDSTLGLVGPRGARWEFAPDRARHVEYVSGGGLVPCDAVSGFLFGVRRLVLAGCGFFDDEFSPAGCEEVDLAQAARRRQWGVCALGGLRYEHEWGVSAWDRGREIAWLGRRETTGAIALRNQARLARKWGGADAGRAFGGDYYDRAYFARGSYLDTMTRPRTIRGHTEPPLVQTMADVVEATGVIPPRGSVLDVGCSYGLLVQELVARGYDARGVDFSADVVAASPVRERIWQGNALDMPLDRRYDAVFAGDIYEHLNDAEARLLTQRIAAVSGALIAIVNKSRHEPSHVNVQPNGKWLSLFADCGLGFEAAATWRGRRRYLRSSAGTEDWHLNLLVVSARRHSRLNRLTSRVAEGAAAWRAAARLVFLWR